MADFVRLRQVCLVAPALEPAVDTLRRVLGLEVCHRDEGVAKYGLVNALFACGPAFLEIVAPTREGTAAGRFLERGGAEGGGYMAIFDCANPLPMRLRAQQMGIRIAHTIDHPRFFGTQLHPRDCRATMLEFDYSEGNATLDGAYGPAGPHWQRAQRLDRVAGLPAVEVSSPDGAGLAAHWSRLIGVPVHTTAGVPTLHFDLGAVRVVPGAVERLAVVELAVPDPAGTLQAAVASGCAVRGEGFAFCGVTLRPVAISR